MIQTAADGDVPLPPWSLVLLGGGLLAGLIRKTRPVALGLLVVGLLGLTGTPPASATDLGYTYDANGNVQTRSSASGTTHYDYDPLDRVHTETGPAGDRSHSYDANDNRLSDGAGTTATYSPNSDKLATINGQAVTLDAAGDLTSDGQFKYVWNQAGQLGQVTLPNGTLIAQYTYDYQGLRRKKVTTAAAAQGAGTTYYHYDPDGHLLAETGPGGTPLMTYVWRDDTLTGVIVHQPARTVYTVETDALGSPYQVRTLQGNVVWRWESEAFGGTAPDGNLSGQPFTLNVRFPGQYYDRETGLHYNQQRYYSPRLARYLSPDPIGLGGGGNLFAYVGGNPLSFVDPLGLTETREEDFFGGGAGGGAGSGPGEREIGGMAGVAGRLCEGTAGSGRAGKQARLRELANDDKLGSADRGWIKQELNSIERGQRSTIRNPPGTDLAHERGREAAKGYDYSHSNLQDRDLHRLQHKYDDFGRANAERPPQ